VQDSEVGPTFPPGTGDVAFDRPVFIVSSPRSGSTLLFETLARAAGICTIGSESHALIESVPGLGLAEHGFTSNRLDALDATTAAVNELRRRFLDRLRDRDGRPPASLPVRMLEKTPKNSLRVPFLLKAFPDARFVFLYRDPRQVLASMIEAWLSGRFQTYRGGMLPGWPAPYWSLLLTPGWRDLAGRPLPEIVASQWQATIETLLRDLEPLPDGRWQAVRYDRFIDRPAATLDALCRSLGLEWDERPIQGLPLARHTLSPPSPDKWRRHQAAIEAVWPRLQPTIERVERLLHF
jgi:sulfotransferase family protein